MDALRGYGELGLGSRLKRISEYVMKETQAVYDYYNVDFDPYLFPIFKIIVNKNGVTNSEIQYALKFTQPAITQALNKLLKKELIAIVPDELDKRKKIVKLSEKGKKTLETLKPIWTSIEKIIKEFTLESSSSLIEHLNILENKLNAKSFSQTIIDDIKIEATHNVEIATYKNEYAKHFYDLNVEWLKTHFYVEPFDEDVLSNPEQYIINKGGYIFFALINQEVVGTVALMPLGNEGVFELTKMAVSPNKRGRKIGQYLLQYCINFAKDMRFPKLILYSNTKLENAIYIYRKYGFIEISNEQNSPYARSDIKMELVF
ncbi:bifunctional helix-turn-helix transcriptional regulator/GNAT family N-acetyltransferase [Tamlana sp. 2201CG12-4]|uniref:bifunctional helix-turn-helix transcriptional regulator/GNAT family N-acetyltransferase n=1 Tax=Tamlana sp. 2201CG12-4 TaxID=3112582 RepID=UPI002DBD0AAE|nr:bifunctional helix-turn-helix transcriptional regulator/GNAT family N-acetyltransferase [Tamlana sp. 2201CG12-4]MEC3907973.1 bifunctional helix-turn-helix transcriptional regulator/GNAT family N-acetyltransferase [Tamlana sp. 2201CG12-4]